MNNYNNKDLISIEWDEIKETLEVHGSKAALIKLKNNIDDLIKSNTSEHLHLMSEEWGGNELSSQPFSKEDKVIHHVKIFLWKSETE